MDADGPQMGLGRTLRRSKRLGLVVRVQVFGQDSFRENFRELAKTVSVSQHGGALALAARLREGQTVLIENSLTREQQECRVANIGPVRNGKWTVGIEFARPAAQFWKIYFPPVLANGKTSAGTKPAYPEPSHLRYR
jgi:hypothetical protein